VPCVFSLFFWLCYCCHNPLCRAHHRILPDASMVQYRPRVETYEYLAPYLRLTQPTNLWGSVIVAVRDLLRPTRKQCTISHQSLALHEHDPQRMNNLPLRINIAAVSILEIPRQSEVLTTDLSAMLVCLKVYYSLYKLATEHQPYTSSYPKLLPAPDIRPWLFQNHSGCVQSQL
jgi:hypothetical protein